MLSLSTQIPWINRCEDLSWVAKHCPNEFPLAHWLEEKLRMEVARTLERVSSGYSGGPIWPGPLNREALALVIHFAYPVGYSMTEQEAWIFQYLPNLQELFLSCCEIEDARHFAHMQHLRMADLSQTWIHDITPLLELPSLEYLDLTGTRLLEPPPDHPCAILWKNSWAWHRQIGNRTPAEALLGAELCNCFDANGINDINIIVQELRWDGLEDAEFQDVEAILMGYFSQVYRIALDAVLCLLESYDSNFVFTEEMSKALWSVPDLAFFAEEFAPYFGMIARSRQQKTPD